MKKAIKNIAVLFLMLAMSIACDNNNDSLNIAEISEVQSLFLPEDQVSINLETPSSIVLEWQTARSEDNGFVIYEVIFDREGGDFSKPIFVVRSDNEGFLSRKVLTSGQLNQIAELAGIERGETGKIKWSVWSSKGLNVKLAQESRIMEVTRPNSFPTPQELYITGTASEGGTALSEARQFVSTGTSSFEIYTMLSPGTYTLVTAIDSSGKAYYIDENGLQDEGETTYDGEPAIYRIRVDFSDNNVSIATINLVELWFSPDQIFWFSFDYVGDGQWEAVDKNIEFKQESWGRDERYKFRFSLTSDGVTSEEWFGSVNSDNQAPVENTPDDFYYMVPVNDSAYDFTFKFRQELDNAQANLKIIFNNTVPQYTHIVTKL